MKDGSKFMYNFSVSGCFTRIEAFSAEIMYGIYRPLINSWPTKRESQCSIHLVDEIFVTWRTALLS